MGILLQRDIGLLELQYPLEGFRESSPRAEIGEYTGGGPENRVNGRIQSVRIE